MPDAEIIVLASIFFLVIGYMFGYYLRDARAITERVKDQMRNNQEQVLYEPKSSILEPPLTPAERVARDQEELLERLNPQ